MEEKSGGFMEEKFVVDEQRAEEYIHGDGVHCPYCGSTNIEGGHFDSANARQSVWCHECRMTWKDIYKLVGIMEESDRMIVPLDPVFVIAREALDFLEQTHFDFSNGNTDSTGTVDEGQVYGQRACGELIYKLRKTLDLPINDFVEAIHQIVSGTHALGAPDTQGAPEGVGAKSNG